MYNKKCDELLATHYIFLGLSPLAWVGLYFSGNRIRFARRPPLKYSPTRTARAGNAQRNGEKGLIIHLISPTKTLRHDEWRGVFYISPHTRKHYALFYFQFDVDGGSPCHYLYGRAYAVLQEHVQSFL